MRTVRELCELGERVFVYFSDRDVGNEFLRNAEREGFVFGDEKKPTSKEYDEVMAIHPDGTLNYLGFIGYMAWRHPESSVPKLIRVDSARYKAGFKNYLL